MEDILFEKQLCKVYNDGNHYIASFCKESKDVAYRNRTTKSEMDEDFLEFFKIGKFNNLFGKKLFDYIFQEMKEKYPNYLGLEEFVSDHILIEKRNLYNRMKRFKRKAYLNQWNYFCTFTYDDNKITEAEFKKQLSKCLSNLHTRRGWKYMGVWEKGSNNERLHFHCLLFVPEGEMVGAVTEVKDYSVKKKCIQVSHSNDWFLKRFGRNDFEELDNMALKNGTTINYLLKYISKSGERIIYSRGIPECKYMSLSYYDVVSSFFDYVEKFVLFDDTLSVKEFEMNIDDGDQQLRFKL